MALCNVNYHICNIVMKCSEGWVFHASNSIFSLYYGSRFPAGQLNAINLNNLRLFRSSSQYFRTICTKSIVVNDVMKTIWTWHLMRATWLPSRRENIQSRTNVRPGSLKLFIYLFWAVYCFHFILLFCYLKSLIKRIMSIQEVV